MHEVTKRSVTLRLRRVEGQVGGVMRMVEEERYCVDILNQVAAIRAALQKVEDEILRDHVSHCVGNALTSGDAVQQRQKIDERVETLGRMRR